MKFRLAALLFLSTLVLMATSVVVDDVPDFSDQEIEVEPEIVEPTKEPEVEEELEEIPYSTPRPIGNAYLAEHFDDREDFLKKWIPSEAKKDCAEENIAKYDDPCEGSATCGPNAECRVSDHRSVCSCREGFVGRPNANVGCIRPQIVCSNEPCPPGLTCHNGQCRMPCSSVRDCAANEKCIDNRCHVQCIRDRDCYSGEICEQNFCRVGCRADTDCSFHEACINNQCIDPCDSPTACGTNANCDVINHSIHCTCPSGLRGDAFTKCDREIERCDADDRCGLGRYCEDTICRVTCSSDNECLDNEKCVERRCSVFCTNDKSCPNGFICEFGQCVSGCRRDSECPLTEACINSQCLDPCASPTACGTHARCQPVDHRPLLRLIMFGLIGEEYC